MYPKFSIHSLAAVAAFGLLTSYAHGTLIPVNSGSIGGSAPPANGIVSSNISVGTGADMLVLMYSGEMGGTGPTTASYGGVPMLHAVGNRNNSAIFYLDLSTPGISGTTLTVDMSAWSVRNGHASGWVSIDGNLGPGESIVLHSTGLGISGSKTVNLVTSLETFNVVSFNGNSTSGTVTVNSPNPTVVYTDNNIGSARGAAAYIAQVPAGSHTYEWTLTGGTLPGDYRQISAAAFAVIPEPSSVALLGLGGLALFLRRKSRGH
jgi:hypothetical protein